MKRRLSLFFAVVLPLIVLLPPLRAELEASMFLHMLVIFPFLVVAGGVIAWLLPTSVKNWLSIWNSNGIPGLLLALAAMSVWMIPLALDRAVESWPVDAVKTLSVMLAGVALFTSLPRAARAVQLFFVWNWVGMTVFIGVLYQSLPVRLCSTYLLNDQERTGLGMVILGAALGLAWCIHAWRGYQRDIHRALSSQ